jgi:hypothetical protein
MNKIAHGKIFAVPLPDGTYVCGRVLLDIYGLLKRRLFPVDSPLPGLGQAFLVEMYSGISKIAEFVPSPVFVPGAFIESKEIGKAWPVVGHETVDPRSVEFPESLIGFSHAGGETAFECGEISVALPLSRKELQRIAVLKSAHPAFLWPFTLLRTMGRESEVPVGYKTATLTDADLRFSPRRPRIFEHLPFSMEQTYFERQAQLGLNFERLYE